MKMPSLFCPVEKMSVGRWTGGQGYERDTFDWNIIAGKHVQASLVL